MNDIVFRKSRAAVTDVIEKAVLSDLIGYFFHTSDKFRSEYKNIHIRKIQTILDLLGRIAEIQRYCKSTCFQDAEINGKPFQTVHEENGNLVSLLNTAFQEKIGETIGFFIKYVPGDFPAVVRCPLGLDEFKFFPCDTSCLRHFRIDLHKTDVVSVKTTVFFQYFCDRHWNPLRLFYLRFHASNR